MSVMKLIFLVNRSTEIKKNQFSVVAIIAIKAKV